ncbi:protein-methionine sulfoxide oxidase mical2b isoform X4 [Siniperca chuatsi]|uniref:protein-methionine sulfoxide oxidase mical2b isoform X4 n=1 Tax=Siniperca chuatsi TaxID=119488 RepID=UPI001CE042C1|nr:protein-methionine sulfoxide oxidase mical2b isoform X4 [Siniperca chuatsi]
MGETEDERTAQASVLFENFVQASTCKGTLQAFSILCRQLELDPLDYSNFYSSLKAAVSTWKVKALWTKLDKRAQHKVYNQSKACQGTRCLIIGGGPCGLRTAIELALLGCKVVVIEKRDTFSRNNVLHLWPFTIHDLRGLGAKKFYGKFCAGSIDHISIRQLQLMLLKVSLILGVEIHVNVEFAKLVEPPAEQTDDSPGWRAEVRPSSHPVSDFDFDVVIGADGRKNTLDGFGRKEFRGKLAIAITANFVNRNTTAEAKVEEISGVAFIFNQKFFLELKEETGIDLENIVYYKDNTHYFVMTAKKPSLLDKGVIINDYVETERLLSPDNVNQEALLSYAREAADFGTNYQLPSLDYAINHYGQPDVAMFDFTSMYASENAALIREKHGHQLLVALVGDSLLEPFWPMGTGCARGFLAAFDSAWMVRGWAQGRSPLEILAERESIYRLLPQTTTENISKNFEQYAIDPATRYPNLNSSCVRPHQVRHLFIDGQQDSCHRERGGPTRRSVNLSRRESEVRPGRLLTWCQKQTQGYRGVDITNLTSSWRNGLALCALIHRQRPELIDYDSLNEEDVAGNNQLAFDLAEREFGIQPVTRGKEMAAEAEPDKLLMVLYLSKFYEAFRNSPGNNYGSKEPDENSKEYPPKTNHKLLNQPQPRKRIPRDDKKQEDDSVNKRRRKGNHYLTELSCHSAPPAGEDGELRENKVRSMATQLLAKFEENSSTAKTHSKSDEDPSDPSFSPPLSPSNTPLPLSEEEDEDEDEEEEEAEEERENPRFAKPKDVPPPPPLPPPRPRWQPSIYLRLLENPTAVAQQTSVLYSSKSSHPQSSYSRSPSPSSSKIQLSSPRSQSPNFTEHYYPERTSPALMTSHFSASDIDHSSERSEESMQQRKAQSLSTREFSRRSIKDRAVLLSSMFPGSNRPPAAPLSPLSESQCVVRKDFPPGLGGSDTCHFCTKRVYVMERLSTEGYFFHRECFRCHVCNCTLRLGGHTFDSQEAKFYCKMHYAQRQSSTHMGRIRRRMEDQRSVTPSSLDSGSYSATDSVQIQPAVETSSLHSEQLDKGQKRVPEDTEMAVEALDASCIVKPTAQDTTGAKGQSQDSTKDRCNTKQNHRWKRKIRATFPLIFIKHFQRSWPVDKEGPETVPEADSDFEEITSAEKQTNSDSSSKTSAGTQSPPESEESEERSATTKTVCNSSTPKKRLMLSLSEKEKLLNWDVLVAPEDTLININTKNAHQHKDQVQAETEADKPQTDLGQDGEPSQSQTSASSPSALQLIANAFRRTFSVTNPSSSSNTAVTMRTKRDRSRKHRPMSEGAFSFSSLFSTVGPEPSRDDKNAGKCEARWASVGADPWGAGQDLPSLLQQVSLKGRRDSGGVFSDDMASLPRRRVNLFSSLRLRKREDSESEEQEMQKEIRTILTNLRNKASSQQNLEEPSSSDDENDNLTSNQQLCTEKQRRRQEKTVAQQAKREQLKRLHRAQAIQRQLEEVAEKQRDQEERGVAIEKMIRGETESSQTDDIDEAQLYQSWFKLVLEKNRLARYESELMIFAQELELEDTQSRLQQDLRCRMAVEDTKKSASELQEEQELLFEIMRTVEKRDMLVSILEEQRLKERAEDRDLESLVLSKGYEFHWTQADDSWGQEKLE